MNLPIEVLLAVSAIGARVAEELFGAYLKGTPMKLAAIGVTVGLTYGAWSLGLEGMADLSLRTVGVLGVFAGLGSPVVHGLLVRFAPASLRSPVTGVLARLRNNGTAAPPTAPTPPTPPSR
jgi:hypothetical protein